MIVQMGSSKKHQRPYEVKPVPMESGMTAGIPVSIFLGDPTDERGHKIYKTGGGNKSPMGVTPRKFPKVKPLSDSAWIAMAISTDDTWPVLVTSHGNWSADGFRMHHISGSDKILCKCEYCKNSKANKSPRTPDFTNVLSKSLRDKWVTQIKVSRDLLFRACNQADAISKNPDGKIGTSGIIILQPGPAYLCYFAENKKTGKISGEIAYIFSDAKSPLKIALNFSFLRDALAGMDEVVTLQFTGKTMPLYITDGAREAVIMPMNLG